jgi:hypothetical protein
LIILIQTRIQSRSSKAREARELVITRGRNFCNNSKNNTCGAEKRHKLKVANAQVKINAKE